MITSTSLRHPRLRIRLDIALKVAAANSFRSGSIGFSHASGISVVHIRKPVHGGFQFFDMKDRNITKQVLTALRESARI